MRLPGTRYQEPGWERVRKLLGTASLTVLQAVDWTRLRHEPMLSWYCEAMAAALQTMAASSRAQAAGNSYGDSALALAQGLVAELAVLPGFWQAMIQTLPERRDALGSSALRKKINDMYVTLRDRVDADYYQISTGRPCSANKIYTWRMLDTAWHEIARLLSDWRNHQAQLGAILGREISAQPIESRRVRSAADCDPAWIIAWSASLAQFGRGVGPLHTQSKRFSSLKNNPATIKRLLDEIADYEAVSDAMAQHGHADWQSDDEQFGDWVEDYLRVMAESAQAGSQQAGAAWEDSGAGQGGALTQRSETSLLPLDRALQQGVTADELLDIDSGEYLSDDQQGGAPEADALAELENLLTTGLEESDGPTDIISTEVEQARILAALQDQGLLEPSGGESDITQSSVADTLTAQGLCLPPGYMAMASGAEDRDSLMFRALQHESLAVRLALYAKQLGVWDESYPDAWLDPTTGELPTMKQLAALDHVSVPTLRKRRDAALLRLQAASEAARSGRNRGQADGYTN